jgi:hypothetical protein
MTPYVPLPTDLVFCTSCRANVVPDAQGRCPADGVLGIYPQGEPRPDIVTPTLVLLQEASRQDRHSRQGVHRQPKNLRQLRAERASSGAR